MATKETDKTLQNVFADEEIFCLRALDETAPLTVLYWIRENFYTATKEKLESAFNIALKMKEQENKRRAD